MRRTCHLPHPQRETSLLEVDGPPAVTPDGDPLIDVPAPMPVTHPARLHELGREEQALLENIFVPPTKENALTHYFHIATYFLVNPVTGLDLSEAVHPTCLGNCMLAKDPRLSRRWSCRYCQDNRGKPIDDPP
eukprot:2725663-Amphidinium_carterae.1